MREWRDCARLNQFAELVAASGASGDSSSSSSSSSRRREVAVALGKLSSVRPRVRPCVCLAQVETDDLQTPPISRRERPRHKKINKPNAKHSIVCLRDLPAHTLHRLCPPPLPPVFPSGRSLQLNLLENIVPVTWCPLS